MAKTKKEEVVFKKKKKKSKLQTCKVEMSYISRLNISSVSTGRATFLPLNEDGAKDERNTAETDPLKFDSRKRHEEG